MPTGPRHYRAVERPEGAPPGDYAVECRCMIGEDHADGEVEESLSVYDAADTWLSNGMDEDYTFGYGEDELRNAAGLA
jgi:hypothetical protein